MKTLCQPDLSTHPLIHRPTSSASKLSFPNRSNPQFMKTILSTLLSASLSLRQHWHIIMSDVFPCSHCIDYQCYEVGVEADAHDH